MRLLGWNIRCGGGKRVDGIAAAVARHEPDLAVLTEYRNGGTGTRLRARLAERGLPYQLATDSPQGRNGILAASRTPLDADGALRSPWNSAGRLLPLRFGGLRMIACYFPQSRQKIPVYEWLHGNSAPLLGDRSLLLGDFNTGLHTIDESGATFIAADRFQSLLDLGWIDVWRALHPLDREYSWYSAAGRGFRIDHALASPEATAQSASAEYSHAEREQGLSDHSILLVQGQW